jgi:methionyl-tRNA formyltransferase
MKILFMGTPDFAAESLKAVYEAGYEICRSSINTR